ncbi:MAG: exodeoxyribonuclease V subunit beta [Desulfobacteraceae bacterium 4572_88]|nr:MAG: exodeoxyribonuclease V subunit beta [Desulfobacteraceae bacterium 4572_88]
MTQKKHFDLASDPLEGTNLIEASAGTGKTYTITGLFLRLILEKHLPVSEILVVTFTEAATAELTDKIRVRLRDASESLARGGGEDFFLQSLADQYGDSAEARTRLEEAIRDFDEAAIFTIHSFCKRMLHEHAFESGSLFNTELVANQETLRQEIVGDFWRRHVYGASPMFVRYVMDQTGPDDLLSLLGNKVSQPGLKIIPRAEFPESSDQEAQYQDAFHAVCHAWASARSEIESILLTDKNLNRRTYGPKSIPKWIQAMDDTLASGPHHITLFEKFEKFTPRMLEAGTKKKHTPPEHPFFDLCGNLMAKQEKLLGLFEKRLLGLKAELFSYARKELRKRKETQNVLSFDDLILNLHRAIRKRGESLVENIQKRFKAALIDEFQDTDPAQYEIFRKVFATEGRILFLIGDPKQAIYGFRGADIFAYMDAARNAHFQYTLGENWRSEPGLIAAVNTVFESSEDAFVYDEIRFQGVSAPQNKKDQVFLTKQGLAESPLHLWFAGRKGEKPVSRTEARPQICDAVAAEISRLLAPENAFMLGEARIRPRDIAVLVRQNSEADMIRQSLLPYQIPSVLHSTANIFDSGEALEMEKVLTGIEQPGDERRFRAALSTDMMGVRGEELDAFAKDESAWEKRLIRFRKYHRLWHEGGFVRMIREFMSGERILPRLMAFPDGERRSTNFLHLVEILHSISVEKKLSMSWLIRWLSDQNDPMTQRSEEHQLRLESDENAVRLVTIHKSKGLEYPIVFCPFTWGNSKIINKKQPVLFHDGKDGQRLTLDLGSGKMDENRAAAERELLAENMRLLYVALTRAKNRCYFVWGHFNQAESSAPAHLFQNMDMETLRERSKGTIHLSEMPSEWEGNISVREQGPASLQSKTVSVESLSEREFTTQIDQGFRISSFSSLIPGWSHSPEIPDRDMRTSPSDPAPSPLATPRQDIFSFPKGARAGTFLHEVFEHLDFTQQDPDITKKLVAEKLEAYDFDPEWEPTICDTIRKVLSVRLDPGDEDLSLSQIRNEDRLNELEFYFPLNQIAPKDLRHLFASCAGSECPEDWPEHMGRLEFSPVRGFMKGFVDMVFQFRNKFYLVDWKSNFLGDHVEDYHPVALREVMKRNFYMLQYLIYMVALHRYLSLRKQDYCYEKHFGGVYYIFLRGVDPGKGMNFGIYQDRPAEGFVRKLCETLISEDFFV